MTANAFEEDRQKALDAGMNAHVSKPVDMNVLFRVMATSDFAVVIIYGRSTVNSCMRRSCP